jgi:hypothetical protein
MMCVAKSLFIDSSSFSLAANSWRNSDESRAARRDEMKKRSKGEERKKEQEEKKTGSGKRRKKERGKERQNVEKVERQKVEKGKAKLKRWKGRQKIRARSVSAR